MDTKKQLTIAWVIAGILAVGLIIALVALMNQKKDLGTVLQEGREDLTEQRDRIAEACQSEDAASQRRCQNELDELSDILRDFSRDIDRATSTAERAQ